MLRSLAILFQAVPTSSGKGIWHWLPSNPDEVRKALLTSVLTLVTALVIFFSKQIGKGLKATCVWIWSRIQVQRASEVLYRKRLASELRAIQILHMAESKDLDTFYVPLTLVTWIPSDLNRPERLPPASTTTIGAALERHTHVTLLGDPGAGKTTLSSHFASNLAERRVTIGKSNLVPIYLHLRTIKPLLASDENISVRTLLCQHLKQYGFLEADEFLNRKLNAGTCLVILDGFDELADKSGKLQLQLAQKVRTFLAGIDPQNRLIVTSRPHSYEPAWFPGFQVFEVCNLTATQMETFVRGWFGKSREPIAALLVEAIRQSDRLQALLSNPLMLAIVCFVQGTSQPNDSMLPNRRVDLYDRCIEALISEWDRSRGVDREGTFTPSEIELVLQQVAFDMLLVGKFDVSRTELLGLVRSGLPKAKRRQYESDSFVKEVIEHTGLLKYLTRDTLAFVHRGFQEYLSARIISDRVIDSGRRGIRSALSDVLRHVDDPTWLEPIALAAGVMKGRTELIRLLYEETKGKRTDDLVLLLATCLRDSELRSDTTETDFEDIKDDILSSLVMRSLEAL